MMRSEKKSKRQALLARVHIGKKALKMTDERYRALLVSATGCHSAKLLSDDQLERVLCLMRIQGFLDVGVHKQLSEAHKKILSVIRNLLDDMNLPWSYAEATSRKMFTRSVSYLSFSETKKLMQALLIYQRRMNNKMFREMNTQ